VFDESDETPSYLLICVLKLFIFSFINVYVTAKAWKTIVVKKNVNLVMPPFLDC
jgi:hypothetical protein